MTLLKYNPNYQRAIAHLAQEFYEFDLKDKYKDINWDDPWMNLNSIPELVERCYRVEDKLDYELSWNQCCNAVAWAVKIQPIEWSHLLMEDK